MKACGLVALAAALGCIVSPLIAQPTLPDALDATNLVWTYWSPWQAQTNITHDGIDAAESGPLRSGIVAQATWLETSVQGPGVVSFWWKAAATSDLYTNADFSYRFLVGGVPYATASEESFHNGWHQVVFPVSAAPTDSTTLRWLFQTLGGCTDPAVGTAWLDQVSFSPEPPAIALTQMTQTNLTLRLRGPGDGRWEIQQSTDLLLWRPLPGSGPLQLHNGEATVQVAMPGSPRCFYRLVLIP
jgi:hypothetical protein